jgi:hypothetical protein
MSKSKNVSKIVSFVYLAAAYPQRWAQTPDEVPVWDVSRGFPETRGGRQVADGLAPVPFVLGDEVVQPDPPPREGYPRLVRASLEAPRVRNCVHESVVNALSGLAKHALQSPPRKSLLADIKRVAEQYGVPHGPQSNTLSAWVQLALIADAQVRAKAELDRDGFEMLALFLEHEHQPWGGRRVSQSGAAWYALPATPGSWGGPWEMLRGYIAHASTPHEYKEAIAKMNLEFFAMAVEDHIETRLPGIWTDPGIYLSGGIRGLLHYQLAELWLDNVAIRECDVCKRVFIPTNTKHRRCTGACRVRASTAKKQA